MPWILASVSFLSGALGWIPFVIETPKGGREASFGSAVPSLTTHGWHRRPRAWRLQLSSRPYFLEGRCGIWEIQRKHWHCWWTKKKTSWKQALFINLLLKSSLQSSTRPHWPNLCQHGPAKRDCGQPFGPAEPKCRSMETNLHSLSWGTEKWFGKSGLGWFGVESCWILKVPTWSPFWLSSVALRYLSWSRWLTLDSLKPFRRHQRRLPPECPRSQAISES